MVEAMALLLPQIPVTLLLLLMVEANPMLETLPRTPEALKLPLKREARKPLKPEVHRRQPAPEATPSLQTSLEAPPQLLPKHLRPHLPPLQPLLKALSSVATTTLQAMAPTTKSNAVSIGLVMISSMYHTQTCLPASTLAPTTALSARV